jgi:hypothetical protein
MDEHLASWQIAEFILGGLDEDELARLVTCLSLGNSMLSGTPGSRLRARL